MILFWDKNIARTIPQALLTLNLTVGTEYYLKHFPLSDTHPEGGDDWWLERVGDWGWTVITQDYALHTKENQLRAMKSHNVGCFYLWGPEASKWEVMRCFARAYDRIIEAETATQRPFIYTVARSGYLTPLTI